MPFGWALIAVAAFFMMTACSQLAAEFSCTHLILLLAVLLFGL